jgi:hypothetical protein
MRQKRILSRYWINAMRLSSLKTVDDSGLRENESIIGIKAKASTSANFEGETAFRLADLAIKSDPPHADDVKRIAGAVNVTAG